jgi:hypothetical protein
VAPIIDVIGGIMTQLEASTDPYHDAGATCTDLEDGQIDSSVVMTGTVDLMVSTPDNHPFAIHYTCCNSDNICATAIRNIFVSDHRCPTCTMEPAAEVTIEASFPYNDPGFACTSPVEEQAYTAHVGMEPPTMLSISTELYGCNLEAGRCWWSDIAHAKVYCASWSECKAVYCEGTSGCYASGNDDSSTYLDSSHLGSTTYAQVTKDREVVLKTVGTVDVEKTGTYVLEYKGTDTNGFANAGMACTEAQFMNGGPLMNACCIGGNTSPLKRTVTVIDTLKPVIGLKHSYNDDTYLHVSSGGAESLYASPGAGNPAVSHFSSDDFMANSNGGSNTWLVAAAVAGAAGVAILSLYSSRRTDSLTADAVPV